MQDTHDMKSEEKRKGVAALFDDYEVKELFRKYIYLLITVEVLIFLVCWVYQLGIDEVAVTGHPVDIPFPWKAYFLVSFSAPVAVTFLVGVVVVAFNSFAYGQRNTSVFKEEGLDGSLAKIARIANFCLQIPFLLSLVLLGLLLGIIYNMETILDYLSRFGEAASKFLLYGLGAILSAGTIYLVARMIINYKLHKRNLEYEFKRDVMDRLGIAILDGQTMIDSKGNVFGPRQIDVSPLPPERKVLPAGTGNGSAARAAGPVAAKKTNNASAVVDAAPVQDTPIVQSSADGQSGMITDNGDEKKTENTADTSVK